MCGIGGVVGLNGKSVSRTDLKTLAVALTHRGPDGEGIWINKSGNVGLVHRRLAILDTTVRGAQPMHSADGRYTIVFNGEIYNFLELREQLVKLGSNFQSNSDTEVLLESWKHWGELMLPRLNGMWALAITDNQSGELFISRDRFGIKPLLYSFNEDGFTFASELRALLALPQTVRELDSETAKLMLIDPFLIEAGERTLVRSVSRLPAGHFAILRDGRLHIKRWWYTAENLPEVPSTPLMQSERFREIFFDAIRICLRSDVPVGTCLSGGFDSSAITCAIADITQSHENDPREAKNWRHAFIGSFPGQANDETKEALDAASYADVEPHVIVISDADALKHITEVLRDLDDVYISLPTAPWQIYRELRLARVVVSLDGHGADELMGGYRDGSRVISFVFRNILFMLGNYSSLLARVIESAKLGYLTLKGLNFVYGHRWTGLRGHSTPFDNDKLPGSWGTLNQRLYRMFHASILPTILRNFDRMSMAHGIEVRMPFMDWRLVTYVMALPDSAKADRHRSKLVARDAMVGRMPENIRTDTRKIGFNSPMPGWMNGPLAPWVKELLSTETPSFSSVVDVSALRIKVERLTTERAWDWQSVGRLWPYIHLKWYIDNVINQP
jgi:asparagine synthase (glutamine-hydrolysing)